MIKRGSRYEGVPQAVFQDPRGRQIPYVLLRITPDAPRLQIHVVRQGDRLDLLSFQFYRDPEQFWRIADANEALRPDDLTVDVGRRLIVPIVKR